MKNSQKILLACFFIFFQISIYPLVLDEKYDNKIHIKIDNPKVNNPSFYLIFSSDPLLESDGKFKNNISIAEIKKIENSKNENLLVLNIQTDKTQKGWCDFYFGGKNDPDNSYASKWEHCSDEIWDNISIGIASDQNFKILEVIIIRGGRVLFDSTKKKSYPNKYPVNFDIRESIEQKTEGKISLLNLSSKMLIFKKEYYELKGNLLFDAYADLGQNNGSKFSKIDKSWCSEFPAYIYRKNGFNVPNPHIQGVWAGNIRPHFIKYGKVFTFRELSVMSDAEKKKNILPGSIICRDCHTYLFTTWVFNEKLMNRYTAISGNNRGMVWAHEIHELNNLDFYKNKTEKELNDLDQKDFFAVPVFSDTISYSSGKEKESVN